MITIEERQKLLRADVHTAQEILDAMLNAIEQAWDCDRPIFEAEWYKDKFGDCHWRRMRRENMKNMTQYQKDLVRMWDSLRTNEKVSNSCNTSVKCFVCPLNGVCGGNFLFNAEKIIEIVTGWAKEHPLVTNEQKYEETFGVKPVNIESETESYVCPKFIGFGVGISCNAQSSCEECKEKFWGSEYKPPRKRVNKQ